MGLSSPTVEGHPRVTWQRPFLHQPSFTGSPHHHSHLSDMQMHSWPPKTHTSLANHRIRNLQSPSGIDMASLDLEPSAIKRQAVCPHAPSMQRWNAARILIIFLLFQRGMTGGAWQSLVHRFLKSLWAGVSRSPHSGNRECFLIRRWLGRVLFDSAPWSSLSSPPLTTSEKEWKMCLWEPFSACFLPTESWDLFRFYFSLDWQLCW